MATNELEAAIEQCHDALLAIVNGDAEPWAPRLSHRDDVTLGNPFGPFVTGFDQVMAAASGAAARYRDGVIVGFDRVALYESPELACLAEVERFEAKVGGGNDRAAVALRVTTLFRREDGAWKVAHRHADPITTPQSSESVTQH